MRQMILAVAMYAVCAALAQAADKAPTTDKQPLDIPKNALVMVVMDPLAAPLSCPCVEGYAQRNYDKLAEFLTSELGRPVVVAYNESLAAALKKETVGRADVVIGKHSVVLADAKKTGHQLRPALALSGKDGQTVMTGLFVVASSDPAKSVADLTDYRIFFGTDDCDEKHASAIDLLKKSGVAPPAKLETCVACSEGATKILEFGPTARTATVISSYAAPLLEGCGTVKKGDLRVIGTTPTVPFVEAFIAQSLPAGDQAKIESALLKVAAQPELLEAIESLLGFVPIEAQKKS